MRFEHSVRTLLAQQVDLVIEIGPKPILTRMAQAVAPAPTLQWLPALVDAGRHGLAAIFAKASEAGLAVDWRAYPHERAARLDDPPLYRFQRESYWLPELGARGAAAQDVPRPAGSRADPAHGANVASDAVSAADANATTNSAAGAPAARVEVRVDPALDRAPWAHVIGRHSVFPAGGYLGLAIEAALRWLGRPSGVVLRDLRFEQMLRLADDGACRLEATARPGDPGEGGEPARATILVRSASADANAWTTHARATAEPLAAEGGAFALAAPADTQAVAMDGASFYRRVAALGYDYAAPFRGITWLRRAGDTVGADLSAAGMPEPEGYAAAPWRLDHCLQTVLAARLEALEADGAHLLLPIGVERLAWHGPLPAEPRVACRVRADRDGVEAELRITDVRGTPCCEMAGLRFARVDRRGLAGAGGAAPAAAPAPASSGSPLHTLRWQRIDPPSIAADEAGRPWLLVGAAGASGGAFAAALGAAGASGGAFAAALGARGARVERLDPRDAHDAAGLAAFERRLADYAAARAEPFGLVHLHADAAVDLAVVRFLAGLPAGRLHRALLVTQGAQAVADEPPDPAAAALWGLGAALQAEAPQQAVTLLDLDAGRDALLGIDTVLRAADAVDAGTAVAWPDHLALRAGRCHQRRLAPATARGPLAIAGDGGYLVTGGLGGLGRCVVEFLHARGAGRIVVLGRSLPAEPPAWLAALQARRPVVELLACDVSDAAQIASVLGTLKHELPLRASCTRPACSTMRGWSTRTRRACGAWRRQARRRASSAGCAGRRIAGRAARLRLAVLVDHRAARRRGPGQLRGRQCRARRLRPRAARTRRAGHRDQLGPWRDTGMLARVARPEATYARLHADPLEPAEAPRWFDALLAVDGAQFCAVHWRLDALARVPRVPALLRGLVTAASSAVAGQAGAAFGRQRLADALPAERAALARRLVAEQIALVTGIAAATIEPAAPLSLLGMDSLMSVALSEALANCLGIAASATLLFDHPTLDALAQHVLAANVPAGAAAPAAASAAAAEPAAAPLDTELSEIEGLQDDDLAALLGKEFIRE